MSNEILKDIIGYEGLYKISNNGDVYSLDRLIPDGRTEGVRKKQGKKLSIGKGRYYSVSLNKNKIKTRYLLHRLLAEAFIPNPENKKIVNHKNGIKTDNRIENLEWCTQSENIIHSFKSGFSKPYWTGKKRDEKTIEALRLSHLGKPSPKKGIKLTEEVKMKSSATWFKKGQIPHNKKAQTTQTI